jgi:putative colanic acid biosynthesis acetyltransferase WcaF
LILGDEVRIEPQVILNANGGINIGSGTLISQYAHLCAANHDYRDPDMRYLASPIVVGQDCWIATDAFVGPDCHIGNGSMLAARSTAFGKLPGGMLLIGEPATPVRPRPAANHTSGNS